ncbi:MAG: hypothetical protein KAT46_03995 [Deltaproteobacteria bacterium]|nr:hypothetical protein [Deltaproteobacteria bacterium]
MKSKKSYKQVILPKIALLVAVSFSLLYFYGCHHTPKDRETVDQLVRTMSTVAVAAWVSGGNAILTMDSDIKQGVNIAVDFTNEPFPPNNTDDDSFYSRARLDSIMGNNAQITNFTLKCGFNEAAGETFKVTEIVFWSNDLWQGTKQKFSCAPQIGTLNENYKVSGSVDNPMSICLVTHLTQDERRGRCLSGI